MTRKVFDAVCWVTLIALAVYGASWVFWRAIDVLTPLPERCTVTLATGEAVTRSGCYTGIRGSGVLYCAEVDYAPAAWVTVTCEPQP